MTRERVIEALRWLSREEGKEAVRLLFREIGYVLRHARFRRVSGNVTVGSSDPYQEGQILSYLSLLYPFYEKDLRIIPVFDRDELHGELHIRGRLRLIHLLVAGIRLLRNREIRKLLLGGRKHGADE